MMRTRTVHVTCLLGIWLFGMQTVMLSVRYASASNATHPSPIAGGTNETFDCFHHWLSIAGASDGDIQGMEEGVRHARLDENTTLGFPAFLLPVFLGHDRVLATKLQQCIARDMVCPPGAPQTDFPCSSTGSCLYMAGSDTHKCICPAGLYGHRCQHDTDECKNTSNRCHATRATCLNTHGSYACQCRGGYFGDGIRCSDVDECSDRTHSCHGNATCRNNNGSFSCHCNHGYRGDGEDCEGDLCSSDGSRDLCLAVLALQDQYRDMEAKLAERDSHIAKQEGQLRLLVSYVASHDAKMTDMDRRISMEENKCGIVSWKAFTQHQRISTPENIMVWNSVFNKTRSDTVLQVTYSSPMGISADTGWMVLRLSILLNGTQCQHPAPITTGFSAHSNSGQQREYGPRMMAGICDTRDVGSLTVSTSIETDRQDFGYQRFGDGFYLQNYKVTSTLYVQELEKC